ncbi:hypothetical protein BCIN_03g02600 [Botrytis cinerea B05.10]|uniref:DUF7730 domain-containing protein n=2 Tax=Botryotinia fuckeliana TaxID=40559 RepID=A0A384JC00_BOTFB|nr:hypothetical protein BCIN_03g02600 [Botrytis cinerea B05.10]ATZ47992.1 hypothetical protein BCIN_03g02600 [Botrytis cinerea B05.10]EMR84537.1 hypothetical protein BcDW1_6872 [Botrytis cinerea BcDW1]
MTSKQMPSFLASALVVLLGVVCFPITCCVICTGGFQPSNTQRIQEARRKEVAKARKKKIRDQPRPLEERRKRELSLESTERRRDFANVFSTWRRDRKTPARLLQLPPEILEKILLEVLGGNTFHLIQCRRRLGHIRCKEPYDVDHAANSQYDIVRSCIPSAQRRNYMASEWMRYYKRTSSPFYTRSDSCLAVLLTCRQLYNQGIPVLYSCNTFDINNPETLLYLSQTVIPSRLKSIKSLQIDVNASMVTANSSLLRPIVKFSGWKMCLEILEGLEGLQNLRLRMDFDLLQCYNNDFFSDELIQKSFEDMLEAIKLSSLRGLRRFSVETNSRDTKGVEQMAESVRGIICA